jgi:hypothetical protein
MFSAQLSQRRFLMTPLILIDKDIFSPFFDAIHVTIISEFVISEKLKSLKNVSLIINKCSLEFLFKFVNLTLTVL